MAPAESGDTPHTLKLAASLIVAVMLIAIGVPAVGPPPGAVPAGGPSPVGAEDLVVGKQYIVSGTENWDDVVIMSSGTLVVPEDTTIFASSLALEGNSVLQLRGGTLSITNTPTASELIMTGSCRMIRIVSGSTLILNAAGGGKYVYDSMGDDVAVDVLASERIEILDSEVRVQGGAGHAPARSQEGLALDADQYSGGQISLSFEVVQRSGVIEVKDSLFTIFGGDGGDAPDGLPSDGGAGGRGGGYIQSGGVSGTVGEGGSVEVELKANNVVMTDSTLTLKGGRGADAGDGGDCPKESPGGSPTAGGGGGGYSGGRGASEGFPSAQPGGPVSGRVGAGGHATLKIVANQYYQERTFVTVSAGSGGAAGDGGDCHVWGGGGGGGYSGGGGGSSYQAPGATGGTVSDEVGSGGDAKADVDARGNIRMVDSSFVVRAGLGGAAGDGGSTVFQDEVYGVGGAGGGGYTAGGGGGAAGNAPLAEGNDGGPGGALHGEVATGGDASLLLSSSRSFMNGSALRALAGNGGKGGRAGLSYLHTASNVHWSGGGGGSYSSGGGGGFWSTPSPSSLGGRGTSAGGSVGDGGDANLRIDCRDPTILRDNVIEARYGSGGLCWNSSAEGQVGGLGAGRLTARGLAYKHVPVSRVMLSSPFDGWSSGEVPVFEWFPVHGSTTHGEVAGYVFELDDDPDFQSPDYLTMVRGANITASGLRKTVLHWHVRAVYSRPPERLAPWSHSFRFTHLNAPPEIDTIPLLNITIDQPKTFDFSKYISDPDDPEYMLRLKIDHPRVLWYSGMRLTLLWPDWEPIQELEFTVSDGEDSAYGSFSIEIFDHNNPPHIMGLGPYNPPVTIHMVEGTKMWLEVRVYDRDEDDLRYRLTRPWRGAHVFSNGTLLLTAEEEDVGDHSATLEVTDGRGGSDKLEFTVIVGNLNDPPEVPRFLAPMNGTTIDEGTPLMFKVHVADPDIAFGERPTVTVISNIDGVLNTVDAETDVSFITDRLSPGKHKITSIIKDRDHSLRSEMQVTVIGKPDTSPVWEPPEELLSVLAFVIISLVLLVLGYFFGYKRAKRRRLL
jgi:hypothetical protein